MPSFLVQTMPRTVAATTGKLAIAFVAVVGLAAVGCAGGVESSGPIVSAVGRDEPTNPPATERVDVQGDPLPPGAVARLGTLRFRTWATSIAFLPGDRVLATVGQEAVSFWDVSTGKGTRYTVDMPWGEACALSADGKVLAVAAVPNDSTIHLWDVATAKRLRQITGHEGRIRALGLSADGRTLVSAGDRRVVVWDTASGKEICRASVGPAELEVALSPDGKTFACAGWDVASAVSIRELATGKELYHYQLPLGIQEIVFAPDGKTLAAVEDWNDDDGVRVNKVHLWDAATGKLRRQLTHREHILGIAFSPDSQRLATGHLETLHVWDLATGKQIERFEGHSGRVDHVAFSGDGKTLATSGNHTLRLWDAVTGREVSTPGGHQGPVRELTFLADGKTLVTGSEDHTLRHWETATGREIGRFPGPGDGPRCTSAAGKVLAFAADCEVRLCEPATGKELRRFRYPDHVSRLALSADGKTLAVYTGGKDLTLRLVDVESSREGLARRYPDFVQALALSPGGEVVVLGPVKPVLPVLDVATGNEIYQLRLPENVTDLAFSPDGKTLAWGAGYGTLRLVEATTGKERLVQPDRDLRSGSQMAFSPDGRVLALGDADGMLRLCRTATGEELRRLPGHRDTITALAFAPDGKTLVSGSWDTTALVWDVRDLRKGDGPPAALAPRQLEALWTDLASDDAARAYRAIHELASSRQSVSFLARRVQPRPVVTDEQVVRLIAELDNERFEAREQAAAELAGLEKRAEPLLRKALASAPSAEVRRRGETLLNQLQGPVTFPETRRSLRTIEVLERAATPEARQLLEKLATGAPEARLTREAKAALARLANR